MMRISLSERANYIKKVIAPATVFFVATIILFVVHFLHTANFWQMYEADKLGMATLFFNRGNYFFGGNPSHYNVEKASWNYNRALTFANPHNVPIYYQIGRVHFIKGDLDQAVSSFNRQLELDPRFWRSYYMRGLTYGYLGRYEEAGSDFKKYLESVPDSWAAHNDIVWVYFRSGNFIEAEKYARRGLDIAPNNPWLSNALGGILVSQERFAEAKPYLQMAYIQFNAIGVEGWSRAYPGNDPRIYEEGFSATLASVKHNLDRVSKSSDREEVDNVTRDTVE